MSVAYSINRAKLAREGVLVEPEWLSERLGAHDIRVLDLRADDAYRSGHVPDAIAFDASVLFDPEDGSLVGPAVFAAAMSAAGVGDEHFVVAYDAGEPHDALRVAWSMRRYGHGAAALVGGMARWALERLPLSRFTTKPSPASFTARVRTP